MSGHFLLLLGIAVGAGVITAISPCVFPVLPILFAGGGTGSRRRPVAIIAGLIASFAIFTLFATWILKQLGLPQDFLRNLAIALLFLLAATLVFPQLGLLLERPLYFLSRRRTRSDLGGGFLLGASLGLVFVPCAGPVLGAISANAARVQFGWRTILVTVFYSLGAAVPMLVIAFLGEDVTRRLRASAMQVRLALGVVMALAALAIVFNADQKLQTWLPGYTDFLQSKVERNSVASKELAKLQRRGSSTASATAPRFTGIDTWINSPPLTLAKLRGKVVLVDFWTYSCINCLRTLPYLEAWDARYRKDGLVIVGVHSPEFAFEHVVGNVESAVRRLHVKYPVAIDNRFDTWDAFGNQYWPEEYLIDRRGHLREVHAGEGDYAITEQSIRSLLAEKGLPRATGLADHTPTELQTPETYLGIARLERYVGSPLRQGRWARYSFARVVPRDDVSYAGRWKLGDQRIVAGAGARIRLHFHARHVYIVLSGKGNVTVAVDGVVQRPITVDGPRRYTVFNAAKTTDALLELGFTPGLDAYSFTFG